MIEQPESGCLNSELVKQEQANDDPQNRGQR